MAAALIFVLTLVLVLWRPRGLGIGWSALAGAALALLTGVVPWSAVPQVWAIVWDATLTFVGLIVIALILDEAGFFRWAALHVVRWGRGSGRRLFPLVVVLGAVVSAGFANDGAALILTPIVLAILLQLDFPPAAAFAFVMASGFVADTTSLPLVISNLINIINADFFKIGFARYATVMVPVDLVASPPPSSSSASTSGARSPSAIASRTSSLRRGRSAIPSSSARAFRSSSSFFSPILRAPAWGFRSRS